MYRILQEAFNNVEKHSGASKVDVMFAMTESEVVVTATDDGGGLAVDGTEAGAGIDNMKERASLLDGTFVLRAAPDEGTSVTVKLPLPDHSAETAAGGA